MRTIILMVLFFLICVVHGKTEIKIGGIFHTDNYQMEIAFLGAINKINQKERTITFIPQIRHIPRDNSFKAQQAVCELTSLGVASIFGPFSQQTVGIVSRVAEILNIPHVTCGWEPERLDSRHDFNVPTHNFTLNVYPDGNTLAKALSELVTDNDWHGFTILYETPQSLMRLKDVLQIHNPNDMPITVRQLNSKGDFRPLLKQIKPTVGDILVDCELETTYEVLKQAKDLEMTEEYQRYLFTSLDTASLDMGDLKLDRANITTMRLFDTNSEALENAVDFWNFVQLKKCPECGKINFRNVRTESVLIYESMMILGTLIADLNSLEEFYVPNLYCYNNERWERGESLIRELTSEALPKVGEITGQYQFNREKHRDRFNLEIVELTSNGFTTIGKWSPIGINYTRSILDVDRKAREELSSKVISVVSKYGDPFLMLKKEEDGVHYNGNSRYEGYNIDLLDEISKILNFTYKIEIVPDGKYGNYDEKTKEWNGVVRHIRDRKADIGVCDLTVTYERRMAVDFTMPFMTLGISILYAKPTPQPKNFFSFLLPLSGSVWICTGTAYVLVSMLIFILSRMAPDEWESTHKCDKDVEDFENIWNLINSSWVTVGSIMQQGSDILPKAGATRIICALWWFFALIMISSYTANMAAFLTNERMENSIGSVEELALQSAVKYGAVIGGSTLRFFEQSNNSLYRKMFATMEQTKPSVFTESNKQGEDRVARSKKMYAFLMESSVLDYIIERNCNLTKLGGHLDSKGYGIAMPMNSIYRKPLNAAILQLQEHGVLSKLKNKWWKQQRGGGKCNTDSKVKTDMVELGVDNVGGVFVILFGGCLCGLIIGIMEFLWNVNTIALAERISLKEAFCREFMFAVKIGNTTKPIVKKLQSVESESVK